MRGEVGLVRAALTDRCPRPLRPSVALIGCDLHSSACRFRIPDLPVAANIGQAWRDEKTANRIKLVSVRETRRRADKRPMATIEAIRVQASDAPRNVAVRKPPGGRQPLRALSRARRLRDRSAAASAAHALRLHLRRRRDQRGRQRQSRQLSRTIPSSRACSSMSRGAATPRCCSAAPTPRRSASPRWARPRSAPTAATSSSRGAAADADIPMILSAASLIRLEEVRAAAPPPGIRPICRAIPRASSRWSIASPRRATRCSC